MNLNSANFAIVHDWFLKKSIGGSEKVTYLIDKFINKNYSKPDLFSLVADEEILKDFQDKSRKIGTSFIQKLPFGNKNVQSYLPILPFAIEQIDLRKYDLVISSSHAFAKGIITSPDQLHISYIHTPMRYAWDQMNLYLKNSAYSKYRIIF